MKHFTTTPQDLIHGDPGTYSPRVALATAEHAILAYQHPGDYEYEAIKAGFLDGTMIERGSAQVAVASHHDVILITARGSSEKGDWLADLRSAFRTTWSPPLPDGCRVGRGFKGQAEDICGRLFEVLVQRLEIFPRADVVVTGHSLGAALVPLIVSYLKERTWNRSDPPEPTIPGDHIRVSSAYMHEPPRVGNEEWCSFYESTFTNGQTPTYMLVNVHRGQADIVTRVPMRSWGFRHVGRRVIHDGGTVFYGDKAWQLHRARNPVSWWQGFRIITNTARSIRAHKGEELLSVLRRQLSSEA